MKRCLSISILQIEEFAERLISGIWQQNGVDWFCYCTDCSTTHWMRSNNYNYFKPSLTALTESKFSFQFSYTRITDTTIFCQDLIGKCSQVILFFFLYLETEKNLLNFLSSPSVMLSFQIILSVCIIKSETKPSARIEMCQTMFGNIQWLQ